MHRLPIRLGTATLALITALPQAHAQMAMMHGHNPNAALHMEMTPGRAVTRWPRHVNWCLPSRSERNRWKETGAPLFGPVVHPNLFSYMVPVDPYAATPSARWGEEH